MPLMMSRPAIHVSKVFAFVWVISLVLVGHAAMFTESIRSRLRLKGFSDHKISQAEGYLSMISAPLTEEEHAEAKAWIETEEKRLGRKLTEKEQAKYEKIVKRAARNLNYEDEVKPVLEAAKEAAKEQQEGLKRAEESPSEQNRKWFSDHSDTILTVTQTVYWMFGALGVGLILGYLLGRSSTKGRSKNKDRPSKVDPSGNADPAHSP